MRKLCMRALTLLMLLALLLTLGLPALAEESPEGQPPPQEETKPEEGQKTEEKAPAPREIYVSQKGSDESGDGSRTAPFASLARAARAANETPEQPVTILLMTDLVAKESARFTGKKVTVRALEDSVSVQRSPELVPVRDEKGELYPPALIELRAPEESKGTAGSLSLVNVILDDALRCGTVNPGAPAGSASPGAEPAQAPAEAPEKAEKAPEAAEEAPGAGEEPAETPEKAPEKNGIAQDAIVSVGDGGTLTLCKGAQLINFGGQSAVHLGKNSRLVMEADSAILDTLETEQIRPAVWKGEDAKVERKDGSRLVERGASPAGEQPAAAPQGQDDRPKTEGEESPYRFSADPETLTRPTDGSWSEAAVSYRLDFDLSELLAQLADGDTLSTGEGSLSIVLDSRLSPDLSSCSLIGGVFVLNGDVTYDKGSHVLSAALKLADDWDADPGKLRESMSFSFDSALAYEDFEPSTEDEEHFLESLGQLSLSLTAGEKTLGPVDVDDLSAKTKMEEESVASGATLVYDPNGGEGGPETETNLPPQTGYVLQTEPKPSHPDEGGVPVIFLGWTETRDEKIYASGETAPALLTSVDIPDSADAVVTVYAVYAYDSNADGIPDTEQSLIRLVYDANGGEGGPGGEQVLAGQTGYALKTEPKPSHPEEGGVPVIFLGWTETPDEKIYASGETAPALLLTVDIPDSADAAVTVYAVYAFDSNDDGIPDTDQYLATLRFDANGGENAPDPIIHVVGSMADGKLGVSIPQQEPNRLFFTFLGWGETANASASGRLYKHDADDTTNRRYQVTQDTTLYAVWKENYRIHYDPNGGENAPAPTILPNGMTLVYKNGKYVYTGQARITTDQPTRTGYSFQGWATRKDGAASYFGGSLVQITGGNVTLYAVWTRGSGTAGGGSYGGGVAKSPRTGDTDTALWAALLGLSAMGLGAAAVWSKKRA